MNLECVGKIKPIVKWKTETGPVMDSALSAFCWEVASYMEKQANELFNDESKNPQERCLKAVFMQTKRFLDEDLGVLLQKQEIKELLAKDESPWTQERLDNWIVSCKSNISLRLEELEAENAGHVCKDTGIVIEHWQCSKKPCYKIYYIALKSREDFEYLGPFFKIGGQPSSNKDWPGFYSSEVRFSDFKRYWQATLKAVF